MYVISSFQLRLREIVNIMHKYLCLMVVLFVKNTVLTFYVIIISIYTYRIIFFSRQIVTENAVSPLSIIGITFLFVYHLLFLTPLPNFLYLKIYLKNEFLKPRDSAVSITHRAIEASRTIK